MLDLLLIATLGFLGSFGHCLGMCGPLTAAFSMSQPTADRYPPSAFDPLAAPSPPLMSPPPAFWPQLRFNLLLNLGRVLSYALVGAAIGSFGSILIAGGHLAGIDSALRRGLAIMTGLLLIWFGLAQINPQFLPHVPLLHPLTQSKLHDRLSKTMVHLSTLPYWWTPTLLGMIWGLIPCGFLYAAQIRAAETGSLWGGAATMLAFGTGTLPMMLGVGVSTAFLSRDRRSQLFRLGGWVTLTIGLLLLLRTSDMVDYTGHAALVCLNLALIARPISRLWAAPLRYRRALGVGAFILSCAHVAHMLDHSLAWNGSAISFLPRPQQVGLWAGIIALGLLTPAALTSFDWMVDKLGSHWRKVHLLALPALLLVTIHTLLMGSSYFGSLEWTIAHKLRGLGLGLAILAVLLLRSRRIWSLLSLEKFYGSTKRI
jgi:uncharacterized protein